MIAILKQSASDEAVSHIVSWIEKKGLKTDVSRGENETIIGLVGDTTKIDPFLLESMDVVERVSPSRSSAPIASSTPRTPSSTAATASRSAAISSRSSPARAPSRARTSSASPAA